VLLLPFSISNQRDPKRHEENKKIGEANAAEQMDLAVGMTLPWFGGGINEFARRLSRSGCVHPGRRH
jgi:hypothetical protein